MQKYHLVLSFPRKDTACIKSMFTQNESTLWLYLGKDIFKRRYIEQDLGNGFRRINITSLHNEVARDIRDKYVHWIDDLNRSYGKNIEWWFGSISSRNVYNSNIFQYCCYLEILERLWTDSDQRPELIFIESIGLTRAIQKWAIKKNIVVDIIYYNRANLKSLLYQLSYFLKWGNFVVDRLLRWVAAYITGKKYQPKKLKIAPSIIVDTFLKDYCLSDDGIFKDYYFPYLHEYLFKNGYQVLVHPVLFGFRYNYFSIYKKMRRSDTHFIIQEDFLRLSDYFSAVTYPIKNLRQKIKVPPFRDFDLYDILKEEQKEHSIRSDVEAVLIYRLFLRLGQSGLRPEQIIDWYENQVKDKALIAGARQAFPQTKIIGAQIFIHSPNFLNLFPSQSEAEAQIVPHILLETSQHQCAVVQSFTKAIPCRPAAALRYAHLFNDESTSDHGMEQKSQKILVLLPFIIAEAVELLETLKEGLKLIRTDIRILIKGHPNYGYKELVQAFGKHDWPNRFEIYNGNLPDALKQASVVISSNSGSMVEAAAKGIPVIFLGRQTAINYNILSDLNMEIVTECYSISELIDAIEKYLNLSTTDKARYKRIGMKIRDLFFEPVNEETLSSFLDFNFSHQHTLY